MRSLGIAALFVVLTALLSPCVPTADASRRVPFWKPDNYLYTSEDDGANERRVAEFTSGYAPNPDLSLTSPHQVVFEQANGLNVVSEGGGTPRHIATTDPTRRSSLDPVFSPDGKYIFYLQQDQVWRVDVGGGNDHVITKSISEKDYPRVSPENNIVIWADTARTVPSGLKTTVKSSTLDGAGERTLIDSLSGYTDFAYPTFSSDGRYVLLNAAACFTPPGQDPLHPTLNDLIYPEGFIYGAIDEPFPSYCRLDLVRYDLETKGQTVIRQGNPGRVENGQVTNTTTRVAWTGHYLPSGNIRYRRFLRNDSEQECGLLSPAGALIKVFSDCYEIEGGRGASPGGGGVPDGPDVRAVQARFRPVLLFDTSEKWRPLDPDKMFSERTAGTPLHRVCRIAGCSPLSSAADLASGDDPSAYIDIAGDSSEASHYAPLVELATCAAVSTLDCDTGPGSRLFAHDGPVLTNGLNFQQFWAFYRFNDFADVFGNRDHEGDWENVDIAYRKDNPATFEYVTFSQHGVMYSYLRQLLSCEDQDTVLVAKPCGADAQRVRVYVANGSHANYPDECHAQPLCSQNRDVGGPVPLIGSIPLPEQGHDGARPWGRNFDAAEDVLLPFGNWATWPGRWGDPNVGEAPMSPGNQPQFINPEDSQCATNSPNCPGSRRSLSVSASPSSSVSARPTCKQWFGGSVAVTYCDPRRLARAWRKGKIYGKKRLALPSISHFEGKVATSAGVVQALGKPLRVGDEITLPGNRASRRLMVRVRNAGRVSQLATTIPARRGVHRPLRVKIDKAEGLPQLHVGVPR